MASAPAAPGDWLVRRLTETLDHFFRERAPLSPGEGLLVAFSGGPDSTALLSGLRNWADPRRVELHAAHLDHATDPDSGERARRAAEIAAALGVPLTAERLAPGVERERRGHEEAARRARYAFLEGARASVAARYVVTAHHRDDQVESVLLRILLGSGLPGLGGIAAVRGRLVRPLLAWSRSELGEIARRVTPAPASDPTNLDTARPRNQLRHLLPPHFQREAPLLRDPALALGESAAAARDAI